MQLLRQMEAAVAPEATTIALIGNMHMIIRVINVSHFRFEVK